jgi:hypothetical protein
MSQQLDTLVFAPEIEAALIALAFAAPWRIGQIMRELDPAVHLSRPECRYLLEAIDIVYRELGARDFASVITALRESSQLEDCGGLEGVNAIVSEYRFGFSSQEAENEILGHYIEMLKAYAKARANQPPVGVYRFIRGDITLFKNQTSSSPSAPQWIGEGKVAGKTYRASAFASHNKTGQPILSVSLCPK